MANKRAKSLKSMTVSELVKERQKHSDRINKIDEILLEATEALGQRVVEKTPMYMGGNAQLVNTPVQPGSIGATAIPNRKYTETAPMTLHAPNVGPSVGGDADSMGSFSLFDAEADARLRAPVEAQQEEKASVDYSEEINTEEIQKETNDLKEQLAMELNNINDIPIATPIEEKPKES